MTLTEYNNQTDPARHPQVILQTGEFRMGHTYGSYMNHLAAVWIEGYNHQYVAKEGSNLLWSTDGDGNPKGRSVFHLPEPFIPESQK